MTISFDLDDTLISSTKPFPTEPRTFLLRILNLEPLRKGSPEFLRQLISQGHRIAIYTTSHRSVARIRWTFRLHGIPIHTIINAQVHHRTLGDRASISSKYPPAFGIDLHIDDSPGLAIEGHKLNRSNYRQR